MFLNSCRKLYTFYLDTVHVINSLESLGKPYRGGKHKEYYFQKLSFYQKIVKVKSAKRTAHLPRILKDVRSLKTAEKILETNKHDLRVYASIENAGIPYGNNDLFAKY